LHGRLPASAPSVSAPTHPHACCSPLMFLSLTKRMRRWWTW
jgi:hypothetical protein